MIFAEVIVDISVRSLDRTFQYRIPEEWEEEAVVGAQVVIPFGKGNRQMKGFIIGLSNACKFDLEKTKSILSIEKQGVIAESHLLSLAYWIKEQYGSTMNDAIKAVMPVRREVREKVERTAHVLVSRDALEALRQDYLQRHYVAKARFCDAFLQEDAFEAGLSCGELAKKWKVSGSVLKGLEDQGVVQVSSVRSYRNPLDGVRMADHSLPQRNGGEMALASFGRVELNPRQREIVEDFAEEYVKGIRGQYLIHGVTGSGKTEVYMGMIEEVLGLGKQVIVLIPEIALTFQTVNRFYERFGDMVSIMHSRLSAGERYDQFKRAKEGQIQIMIGPRSALFAPFRNLGLIVMDEEHESGYQSDSMPRYHAREVAVQRGKMLGASVVFGSATPSLEAYYRASSGEYKLYSMMERAGNARLPEVSIVDLRQEFAARNYSVFSRELQEKMEERLGRREQMMLFINRRGYAGFVSCRTCGEVIQCDCCSVAMKPHEYRGKVSLLKCHYCGRERRMPETCPACGSRYIGTFGLGTQQVEEMVRKRFPTARVLRMDADTTSGKEGHSRILGAFSRGEADVLVGTQMIVKGHDFPKVTLVGVLAADLSLYAGDYRGAEKTFQLLTQAAGRAGRGERPGQVVFQTYQPEHYSITSAAEEDYIGFYRQELKVRQMLHYPPISHILEVLVSSESQERGEALAEAFSSNLGDVQGVVILGPADAGIAKLKNSYRKVLYIKSGNEQVLRDIAARGEKFLHGGGWKDCTVTFSFD